MTHREYYRAAKDLAASDPAYIVALIAATESGDRYIRPMHIRILRLALRMAGMIRPGDILAGVALFVMLAAFLTIGA